jgi:5-methylthioadenosine/S-adenosylhomocysteine deaminase
VLPDPDEGTRAVSGDLLIEGDRIARLGDLGGAIPPGARILYASGCAVLPGFVQSHVHLCQTIFRGAADDLALLEWLRTRVWPLEAAHDPDSMRASARLGVAELLLGGTTAVQTMESVRHTEAVLEVLEDAGLFAIVGKCLMDDPATCSPDLVEPTDVALQEAVDLAETWDGRGDDRLRICLAPRFAVSCTDECLRAVGELAATGGWRIHTHASENRDEIALVQERSGRRNIEYLDQVGCTGEHVGLAHCVWVDEQEVEILLRSGTHVLHCPTSNCKLGSGIAPIPEYLAAGVPVSLGADGTPCNNNLDMFTEMRLAALVHKADYGAEAMPAPRVLDLATRGGAAALGLAGRMGVLAEGAWANVVLVDLEGVHATPGPDVLSTLVYACRTSDIRAVWLAGRQVVSEGRLTLWDEDEIRSEALHASASLFERAGI